VLLKRLHLYHFRNLAEQELEFPPQGVAVVGGNAQGKSNLLEAIYYLETLRSFRGARDEQLVTFGEEVFRLVAILGEGNEGEGGAVELTAAFQRRGRKKKVTLDRVQPPRLGDGLGRLGAVLFSPADVALVSGPPSERRRFLDILLSLNVPGYLLALQRFRHVLDQRNAALREGSPPAALHAWDGVLVSSGAAVTAHRRRWVLRWRDAFAGYYRDVSGRVGATLAYRTDLEPPDAGAGEGEELEAVKAAYAGALAASRERERRMGVTVVGPHRDELVMRLEGEGPGADLRDFGSGGQRRTAALALRLVEADTIRERRGTEPVMLLDDAFAELDEGRSGRILELLDRPGSGQVILTAPREADVRLRRESLPRWGIREGVVLR